MFSPWSSPDSAEGDDDAPRSWGWFYTPAPVLLPWMPSGHKHKSHDYTVSPPLDTVPPEPEPQDKAGQSQHNTHGQG